jgi:prevent-host-death family protein
MKHYSLYEAKARLSEIVRRVRERGEAAVITYHGEPVAEIRPLESAGASGWEARLRELERRGVLRRSDAAAAPLRIGEPRPGALRRFLEERER